MVEKEFLEIFLLLRRQYYQKLFSEFETKTLDLNITEAMCVEVVYLLKNPTLKEFADYTKVSPPNATYRVNSLISKGYVERVASTSDKREFFLQVTDKFLNYYGLKAPYIKQLVGQIYTLFSPQELQQFEGYLKRITDNIID